MLSCRLGPCRSPRSSTSSPQLTLQAIADLGFALGGGQALHAHGYGDRLSLDLDFYVSGFDQELFDRAETATLAALRARGYTAAGRPLRHLATPDPRQRPHHRGAGRARALDRNYRQNPPIVITGLGPVIDLPDAAASKARALNDRRAVRDYLDIHALLGQHRMDTCPPVHRPSRQPAANHHNRQSSQPTSPPRASRTRRTTTPTDSPTPTSPASPRDFASWAAAVRTQENRRP